MSQLDGARIIFVLCAVAMTLVSLAMWSGQLFSIFDTITAVAVYGMVAITTAGSVVWLTYAEAHERRAISRLFDADTIDNTPVASPLPVLQLNDEQLLMLHAGDTITIERRLLPGKIHIDMTIQVVDRQYAAYPATATVVRYDESGVDIRAR